MSDFFDNGTNNSKKPDGEYSYSHSEINQGESYYQWSPYEDNKKKAKKDKKIGFPRKLGRAAAIALVFGLVAGIAFQSVGVIADKYFGNDDAVASTETTTIESTESAADTTEKTAVASTTSSTASTINVSDLAANVLPAIVQVTNVGLTEYQTFFGSYQQESTSCGSGIIIDQDDEYIYIATNNHVVSDAETLTITFCDESSVAGEIKGTDSSCDLAVIAVKIDDIDTETLSEIKVATVGDSDSIQIGEGCVVIGNALGYGQSVTVGIVSAKDREVELTDDSGNTITNSLIQTDAAVNPGNSGGALLNMDGEVIGIVSAKLSSESVEGIGYAIPISYASSIIQQMIDNDVVSDLEASYLGIAGTDITSDMSAQYGIPVGVYVAKVVAGSGAEEAGITEKDVITAFNGRTVTSMSTIQNIMQYLPAGTQVELTVAKAANNYEEETVTVTLTHKIESTQ